MITDGYETHCVSLAEKAIDGAPYKVDKSIICDCLDFVRASKNAANFAITPKTNI